MGIKAREFPKHTQSVTDMALDDTNTFISAASDSKASEGTRPQGKRAIPTVAEIHYRMLVEEPYAHTQRDVLFESSSLVRGVEGLTEKDRAKLRELFFSKPQACLRTSPLAKTYGWGIHFDAEGRVAAFGIETKAYATLATTDRLTQTRAMNSKRT